MDCTEIIVSLFGSILSAAATIGAVVYSNRETKKQLTQQQKKFDEERISANKEKYFVTIKTTLILTTLSNILDNLIIKNVMQNDYRNILLFSGEDGFSFYDEFNRHGEQYRLLLLENNSNNNIKNVQITTMSILLNEKDNHHITYNTSNSINLLQKGDRILFRITNDEQFKQIILMHKEKIPHTLQYDCKIKYLTLAKQEITYIYKITIKNDCIVNTEEDNIQSVKDIDTIPNIKNTPFRNLQYHVSMVDKTAYLFGKAACSMYNFQLNHDTNSNTESNSKKA